jgi:hypothetical protein
VGLVIEKFLACDGCGEPFGVDMRCEFQTVKLLRKDSKDSGWTFKDGEDFCDKCTPTPKTPEGEGG